MIHNEDPESTNLPPHDIDGDEEAVDAEGPVTTAAQLIAPAQQQTQMAAPAAPMEPPFQAGVS